MHVYNLLQRMNFVYIAYMNLTKFARNFISNKSFSSESDAKIFDTDEIVLCRGYYRCTYRTAQGCPATKQVQRSDTDLSVFDVTYQGEHTCHQRHRHAAVTTAHGGSQSPPAPAPVREQQDPSMQLRMGFRDALKVETAAASLRRHDGDYYDHGPASAPAAPFSFPSALPFHHHHDAAGEAAAALSPSPPGSGYFSSAPPHHCSAYDVYNYEAAPGASVRGADSSELGEVVSRATAAASTAGFDYSSLYHHAELDPHLPFAPFGGPSSHGPYQ